MLKPSLLLSPSFQYTHSPLPIVCPPHLLCMNSFQCSAAQGQPTRLVGDLGTWETVAKDTWECSRYACVHFLIHSADV